MVSAIFLCEHIYAYVNILKCGFKQKYISINDSVDKLKQQLSIIA